MIERTTSKASAGRWLGRALLVAVPLVLVAIAVHLITAALTIDPRGCRDPTGKVLPAYWLIGVGAIGLLGGRLLGWRRYRAEWLRVPSEEARQSALIGSVAFMALTLVTAVILVYEAVAVHLANQPVSSLEPITAYVRCAVYEDLISPSHGVWTVLVTLMSTGLVGHWLWSLQTRAQLPADTEAADAHDAPG